MFVGFIPPRSPIQVTQLMNVDKLVLRIIQLLFQNVNQVTLEFVGQTCELGLQKELF